MLEQDQVRSVAEVLAPGAVPLWVQPDWAERFPWLVQGTTGRGGDAAPFDLGLSGVQPVGAVLDRWRALLAATGIPGGVHARQVHGADTQLHQVVPPPGVLVMDRLDGHLTAQPRLLLSVGVADCVPVSLLAPGSRAVALLHAGWRGTAADIVERGVAELSGLSGEPAGELWLHAGPAICGACYEVGPEVHAAVNPGQPVPAERTPIDVRAAIAGRARALGLRPERISLSSHCTRCGPPDFFSHRGGSAARQMGIIAVRA
jgi:YfiH family protein